MNTRFSHNRVLEISKISVLLYFLIFQAWKVFVDYPEGVINENYSPVGIFNILIGPLSNPVLDFICYLWPLFLLGALVPKISRICLFGSFILGCYVLGYPYNFGRTFHGTSLALQILLVFAIAMPSYKSSAKEKEARARLAVGIGQLVICLAYFSSGIAKLVKSGFEWALSENLAVIIHTQALSTPFQDWLLQMPSVLLQGLALFVLMVEVTSLLPWFFPRLRLFYVISWSLFHLGVALTLGGHVTFFSHLFLFPLFLKSAGNIKSWTEPS